MQGTLHPAKDTVLRSLEAIGGEFRVVALPKSVSRCGKASLTDALSASETDGRQTAHRFNRQKWSGADSRCRSREHLAGRKDRPQRGKGWGRRPIKGREKGRKKKK